MQYVLLALEDAILKKIFSDADVTQEKLEGFLRRLEDSFTSCLGPRRELYWRGRRGRLQSVKSADGVIEVVKSRVGEMFSLR